MRNDTLSLLLLLGTQMPSGAALNLVNGSSTFEFDSSSILDVDGPNATLSGSTGLGSLYSIQFFTLQAGASTRLTDSVDVANGATGSSTFPALAGFADLTITANFSISDDLFPDLDLSFTISNNSLEVEELSVIAYFDYDYFEEPDGVSATVSGDGQSITATRLADFGSHTVSGAGADRYEIGDYPDLLNSITAGSVLSNSGSPYGPGDYTNAFQWDLVMEPETVQEIEITSDSVVIPESGSSLLLATLGFLGLMKRSRKRVSS